MADVVHDDVVEQILIELDVKELIRCKSVCKSWYSLITSSGFINRHLNLSYNKDRYNNNLGHRRVSMFKHSIFGSPDLVGSSNGLVCIFSSGYNLIVGNPLTREVRQLTYPTGEPLYCGFGYDSFTEDYKVIVGVWKGENQTCFRILSLKSNVWRDVGEENYNCFINEVGVLYNGALHWIVGDQNKRMLIISYDLCKEEFKEMPQPVYDARYKCSHLGIVKECLCIVGYSRCTWLMKMYHVKESWELEEIPYDDMKYDVVYTLRYWFPFLDDADPYRISEHRCWGYTVDPKFLQSLVSPHVSEVSKEPETAETFSDLTEPNEQIQEVVKESVAVSSERKNLGGPCLEKQSNEPVVQQDEAAVNPSVNDKAASPPKLIYG
ncbi:F-box protein At3g07870-like [Bidens hawaiensis]|uniref:F-box protein At3g07870-like n=1 Tax=Bidens hawaiensis TaxID=980011 RepID=UPI004049CB2E